jgi:16S rRNA (adenine1518-N6/adenine1519-N6)-dimethyltransferase
MVMQIPPEAFTPPPKVTSAVVHLERRETPLYDADAKVLERVVAKAFGQRRKMLRASLKGLVPDIEDVLRSVGIKPTDRAENISVEQFCALARAVAAA